MALSGRTGQMDSQPPQPIHKSGLTCGMVNVPLKGTIRTACVGQCSEQAPQSVFSVFTMHRSMKKLAMPTWVVAFSSFVIGRIACVGQMSEQTVHS